MLVGEGDSREESALGGVLVPVIGVVAPSVADQDHLAPDRGGSEGRLLVIGAWKTSVPGGRSSRMVLVAIARPSRLVCLVSCRHK